MPKPIDVSKTGYALDVKRYAALAEKGHTIRVLNDDGSLHMIMSIPQERLECCDAAKQLEALRDAAAALIVALPGCNHLSGLGAAHRCGNRATMTMLGGRLCDDHADSIFRPLDYAAPLRALQAVLAEGTHK